MKIGILIILAVLLSACSATNYGFYRGTVEKVRQYPVKEKTTVSPSFYQGIVEKVWQCPIDGKTAVHFSGGKNITCILASWIEPGDLINVRNRKADGRYFSNCEFCK